MKLVSSWIIAKNYISKERTKKTAMVSFFFYNLRNNLSNARFLICLICKMVDNIQQIWIKIPNKPVSSIAIIWGEYG